jgi:hypothetical protein
MTADWGRSAWPRSNAVQRDLDLSPSNLRCAQHFSLSKSHRICLIDRFSSCADGRVDDLPWRLIVAVRLATSETVAKFDKTVQQPPAAAVGSPR